MDLTKHGPKDAVKIEHDLMEVVPKEEWLVITDLFIEHGRQICDAKNPRCEDCPIEPLCPSSQEAGLPDLYRVAMSRAAPLSWTSEQASELSQWRKR